MIISSDLYYVEKPIDPLTHNKKLGSDGTNTNAGRFEGCIPYLEKLLGHPVHWEICLLHGNELPFQAMTGKHLDQQLSRGP